VKGATSYKLKPSPFCQLLGKPLVLCRSFRPPTQVLNRLCHPGCIDAIVSSSSLCLLLLLIVPGLPVPCFHPQEQLLPISTLQAVRKTLKLKFLFFFIYFCPVEPKHDSKCSQTDHGNNNSHTCKYSIVYMPVCVHPHSMIKYSTIYVCNIVYKVNMSWGDTPVVFS